MTTLKYMEFSLFGHPFGFHWPGHAATLNPLAITGQPRPESIEAYILARCAARSHRIVEFGTQFGLYSVVMAHALPDDGKLVGLEILPLNAQVSNENLKANGLDHKAIVLHAAASDRDGYEPAQIDIHRENASLLGPAGPIHGIGTMDVPQFSLQRLETHFGPFDMIKMDIEGFEANLVPPSAFDQTGISIAAIEVHPHAIAAVFGKDPIALLRSFDRERYDGFLLIGRNGRFSLHELDDDEAVMQSLTANAFLFKRGKHDDLVGDLRAKVSGMNDEALALAG